MSLAPANLRQLPPEAPTPPDDIVVEVAENGPDAPLLDGKGNVLQIQHDDGSITISLDGSPLASGEKPKERGWFDNLAEDIDSNELSRIADDLLRGISEDDQSRKEWLEDRATGIKLLGTKLEIPGLQGASEGAPIEGMSKVRHPLLLEAVLRFQANARSELLPADGPVKIRNDSTSDTSEDDQLADAFAKDLNHYLTSVATEYYPDTDRMLLKVGFGGLSFKKVYYCPLRMRPVSETVDADDVIVNNNATDLKNAIRVTHVIDMRPSVVKRMQILGVYRNIDLSTPKAPDNNAVKLAEKAQQGISPDESNPEYRNRQIYECYCELDIKGFEHKNKGKETGLPIPYRVTIDVTTREILALVRNYSEDTKDMPVARTSFVAYIFVPGFGFYPMGLLHLLGNTTNALTAAWREMLDNGMYANFPGFLMADTGGRQNTNIFRVPPGGGAQVKTGGLPIGDAIMPLPYNTQHMQPLMNLTSEMSTTGQRVGGTAELQVGEGRSNAPVGTTLALIEQAVVMMNAVHKRLCTSQAEEFKLIVECFREHPESFWAHKCKTKTQWDVETFLKALENCELVPQADPNTSSNSQRLMKVMALKQLQQANPSLYDPIAIDQAAIRSIGYSDPQQFMAPPQAQQSPPPEIQQMMAKLQNDAKNANAKELLAKAQLLVAEATAAEKQAKAEQIKRESSGVDPVEALTAHAKLEDANTRAKGLHLKQAEAMVEDANRDQDRASRDNAEIMGFAKDIMRHQGAPIDKDVQIARDVYRGNT